MKCQILFSGKSKKNINNLSSPEFAQRVVKVQTLTVIHAFSFIFGEGSSFCCSLDVWFLSVCCLGCFLCLSLCSPRISEF